MLSAGLEKEQQRTTELQDASSQLRSERDALHKQFVELQTMLQAQEAECQKKQTGLYRMGTMATTLGPLHGHNDNSTCA